MSLIDIIAYTTQGLGVSLLLALGIEIALRNKECSLGFSWLKFFRTGLAATLLTLHSLLLLTVIAAMIMEGWASEPIGWIWFAISASSTWATATCFSFRNSSEVSVARKYRVRRWFLRLGSAFTGIILILIHLALTTCCGTEWGGTAPSGTFEVSYLTVHE
ncbi:MAG: hypothetical protein CTY38_00945 [Methylotenera sp.]|uniref:hypothetical protein n=1 Tax=Methylotenera sp. TaxID=2051956 RepID=UPI000D401C8F|nr:hypothetical protein [Methylotenera sp.]PPC84645.1 MAG: hypothetical protein CTY38_00945 [Methylotenera sp.]